MRTFFKRIGEKLGVRKESPIGRLTEKQSSVVSLPDAGRRLRLNATETVDNFVSSTFFESPIYNSSNKVPPFKEEARFTERENNMISLVQHEYERCPPYSRCQFTDIDLETPLTKFANSTAILKLYQSDVFNNDDKTYILEVISLLNEYLLIEVFKLS